MVGKAVIKIVRRYLREVQRAGIPVLGGVIYGSHARGQAGPESDIDLLVISGDGAKSRCRDIDLLWKLRARIDWRIEPVLVSRRRWRSDHGSPLLATIRQEGYLIRPELNEA